MKPALLLCLVLTLGTDAFAHRLDEYLQTIRVSVTTNRIDLSFELTPGTAVADQFLAVIDKNQDGQFSAKEVTAYIQRFLKDVCVKLDEKFLVLTETEASFPSLPEIKAGVGIIHIKATAPIAELTPSNHSLGLTNLHLPEISVYQVNALAPKDRVIKTTKQTRDELQKNYRLEFSVSSSTQ
jgi:hypothetical protein